MSEKVLNFDWIDGIATSRVEDVLYYLAFFLYSVASNLGFTTIRTVGGIPLNYVVLAFQVIVLCCLLFKFLSQKINGVSWVVSLFLVAIGLISWQHSGENYFLWIVLFVISGFDANYRKLARLACVACVLTIIICLFSLNAGLANDVVVYGTNGIRHSMGFIHPNSFGRFLVVSSLSFSTAHYGRGIYIDLLVAVVCASVAQIVAGSRTSVLLLICLIVLLIVSSCTKSNSSKRAVLSTLFFIVLLAILSSFYFMFNYDVSVPAHRLLDSLLSGRLSLSSAYADIAPFTLFGNGFLDAPFYGLPATFTVDNAWCHLFLRAGIIPTLILLLGEIVLLWRVFRLRIIDGFTLGLFLMSLYSFSETVGIMIESNFYLIAMAPAVLSGSVVMNRLASFKDNAIKMR